MSKADVCIEYAWRCWCDDEMEGWALEYAPFMGDRDAFEFKTPLGTISLEGLDAVRGLHALLGEAIKKAEQTPPTF